MDQHSIGFVIFVIFTGASLLATLALFSRQAMLVAYILLGLLLGPTGFGLIKDASTVRSISEIGIMFLLFLLGLNMHPQKLVKLFHESAVVTILSSFAFAVIGTAIAWFAGFDTTECLVIGGAMMFSSTILGLKLLPTTVLHHKRTGEIIISILLLQDLIAILVLLLIEALAKPSAPMTGILISLLYLPLLFLASLGFARWILLPLMRRFDSIQEYLFLLAIGWCLGVAEVASQLKLSPEIGAFIAGVALAANPISTFIAESLKPLRDFFLILFFFSVGAGIDLGGIQSIALPAFALAIAMLAVKPLLFRGLLRYEGEPADRGLEIGTRLGQVSEFSLLIAVLALDTHLIGQDAAYLIQVTTVLTFIASSYWIVLRYPTPIAVSAKLRRN
jgi:Kef-type K+ transport system membrane component KefB